jgi:hypothetical protein
MGGLTPTKRTPKSKSNVVSVSDIGAALGGSVDALKSIYNTEDEHVQKFLKGMNNNNKSAKKRGRDEDEDGKVKQKEVGTKGPSATKGKSAEKVTKKAEKEEGSKKKLSRGEMIRNLFNSTMNAAATADKVQKPAPKKLAAARKLDFEAEKGDKGKTRRQLEEEEIADGDADEEEEEDVKRPEEEEEEGDGDEDGEEYKPEKTDSEQEDEEQTRDGNYVPYTSPNRPAPKRRRGKVPFSEQEVVNLRAGVRRFGIGSWKKILDYYDFEPRRTSVDLKDKWRNLEKKGIAWL